MTVEHYGTRYKEISLAREKVFRDPVHDYIHIRDEIILALINTREFQRLRRIRQLGTSSYIFHGAEHSRFSHSLGVYEITRRIINNFVRNFPVSDEHPDQWDDRERIVALCAALLHDIGHGPFSHTFEGIFNTDHEAMTRAIIMSPETEVNAILRGFDEHLPEKVASVIDHTYHNEQVIQLISSQIDADRMDYLLRDAYFAGVSYGTYDLTRILRVIRPQDYQIYFDFSGMHAVEDYVVSRYQMYMQVYFHPVSRGMEELLSNLLDRAKYCYENKPEEMKTPINLLKPFLENDWGLIDYLYLDDQVLGSYINQWQMEDDPILSDLAYRFMNRHPLKSMLVSEENRQELITAVQQILADRGYDVRFYFGENSSFDTPYDFFKPYSTKTKTQIDLITKTGQIVELSQASLLVSSFTGRERGDHRIYFPREILSEIRQKPIESLTVEEKKVQDAYQSEVNDVTQHIQQRLF